MNKIDKELDKLKDLQQECTAMKFLNADEDLLKKQIQKIRRQSNKVVNMIEASSDEQKQ